MTPDEFVILLRTIRVDRRWSYRDLAERVGVSVSAVHGWESGAKMPSLANAIRWAVALGYTVGVSRLPAGDITEERP